MPRFESPGPGRYNPKAQGAVLSTKPRVTACRFGSEDRFKYLGPQQTLQRTSSGMFGGYTPQTSSSPGPGYIPKYGLVHSNSRVSAFSVERRDTGGINARSQMASPGPGLYNPSDASTSTRRNFTAGGGFLANDRQKYLGDVDPASGMPVDTSTSPGPAYMPQTHLTQKRPSSVSFGHNRGPGSATRSRPSLAMDTPGPGAYDLGATLKHGSTLSTKPSAPAPSFGFAKRGGGSAMVESSHCFHGKVPVDMSNAKTDTLSPGPGYLPADAATHKKAPLYGFGTAKRFTRGLAPVKG